MPPPNFALDAAVDISTLSRCRSKRGVAIFRAGYLISAGHNKQVEPFECDGSLACKARCRETAVHAEQMALLLAGIDGAAGGDLVHVKTVDGVLVPSGGPSCVQCSKLIVAAGVKGVWLYDDDGWRRYEAQEFHALSAGTLPACDNRMRAACMDCGLPYQQFPLDLLLPRSQWIDILSQTRERPDLDGNDGGLLCAQCIVKRAAKVRGATGVHAVIEIAPWKDRQ